MKRIISVIGLALVIGALMAASALAVPPNGRNVKAPNPSSEGSSNGNTPTREQKACIPRNDGTDTAEPVSPAVQGTCFR